MRFTYNTASYNVSSIAELPSVDLQNNQTTIVASDGIGIMYVYDSSKSSENDGINVINGWVKQKGEVSRLNLDDFGGDPTGATLSTTALKNAIESVPAPQDIEIYLPAGSQYLASVKDATAGQDGRTVRFTGSGRIGKYKSTEQGFERNWNNYGIENNIETATPNNVLDTNDTSLTLRQCAAAPIGNGGDSCKATATIVGGVITAITITDGGAGYSFAPRVIIAGDGDTLATATATVSGGSISVITVDDGGTGYTDASTTIYVHDGTVVVVAGDSVSTPNPSASVIDESQWSLLKKSITSQNPNRKYLFINRAIGGETWTGFYATPANPQVQVNWYGNMGKAWIKYIEDIEPDLLFMGFGMNDRQNFVQATLKSSLDQFNAFTKKPDMYIITNMVSTNKDDQDGDFSGYESQEGRNFVAGFERSYARHFKVGLIDINRQFNLVRDGVDVLSNALYKGTDGSSLSSGKFESSELCRDFRFDITMVANLSGTMTFRTSFVGVNGKSYLELSNNGGFLNARMYMITPGSVEVDIYSEVLKVASLVSGDNLVVTYKDLVTKIEVNDVEYFERWSYNHGGLFHAQIEMSESVNHTLNNHYISKQIRYPSRLTDYEIFGSSASRYGGNKINHPSSLGVEYIMKPVIENANFVMPTIVNKTVPAQAKWHGINVFEPKTEFHVGSVLPIDDNTYTTTSGANTFLIDGESPGMSIISSVGSNVISYVGTSAETTIFGINYVTGAKEQFWKVDDNEVQRFYSDRVTYSVPMRPAVYTMATLPTATNRGGDLIMVSDAATPYSLCYSNNGASWLRVADDSVVS